MDKRGMELQAGAAWAWNRVVNGNPGALPGKRNQDVFFFILVADFLFQRYYTKRNAQIDQRGI